MEKPLVSLQQGIEGLRKLKSRAPGYGDFTEVSIYTRVEKVDENYSVIRAYIMLLYFKKLLCEVPFLGNSQNEEYNFAEEIFCKSFPDKDPKKYLKHFRLSDLE